MTPDQIKQLQRDLASLGFNPGTIDGVFGMRTASAWNDAMRRLREQSTVGLNASNLSRLMNCPPERAVEWLEPLTAVMMEYGIMSRLRAAMFLAQIGHESQGLLYTTEIWGPTTAQVRYEGRADLGNYNPGDGSRYRGHGLMQITGRANHARARDRLRARLGPDVPDFEADPEALAQPKWAAYSAGDFWDSRGLNAHADAGDLLRVTKAINGGTNGMLDREARYKRALEVL